MKYMTRSTTDRLAKLRDLLRARNLYAYLLPSEDEHFNEYVDASDMRCAFLSGFTGSTCTAIITLDKAGLWADGRYHQQAAHQLDENWTLMRQGLPGIPTEVEWLLTVTPPGSRIGYDPRQFPSSQMNSYLNQLQEAEASTGVSDPDNTDKRHFIGVPGDNLVDMVWSLFDGTCDERPKRPSNPLTVVPISFAGYTWHEKVSMVLEHMKKRGSSFLVISMLDEIAWLLNLRGSDIHCNPVFFAYVILCEEELHVFLDPKTKSASPWLSDYLKSEFFKVTIKPYAEFFTALECLSNKDSANGCRVWLDVTANQAMVHRVHPDRCLIAPCPITALKATKTPSELAGIRQASLVDSLILCDFLAWLQSVANASHITPLGEQICQPLCGDVCQPAGMPHGAPSAPKHLTEASLAGYLDALRLQADTCVGPSFSTILGIDANSAVVHYKPVAGEDKPVTNSSLCLIDSGGQYLTGTTDVTRTLHLGKAVDEVKACYTLVLKAHIALASQLFPSNTPGSRLDVIARHVLWKNCLDYQHGTGHGVGAYLCVHEGPIGISGRRMMSLDKLNVPEPGLCKDMVVTVEPGLYLSDHFGVRLENVVSVVRVSLSTPAITNRLSSFLPIGYNPPSTEWLTFEPVTLVPFQRDLIVANALTDEELSWLNKYHAKVRQELRILLAEESSQVATEELDITRLCESRQRCWKWILKQTEAL